MVLPDLEKGCSLAESCPPETFEKFVKAQPDHTVIAYMNCSAEIKALTNMVCTSFNALKTVVSIPKDKPIIFCSRLKFRKVHFEANWSRYVVTE